MSKGYSLTIKFNSENDINRQVDSTPMRIIINLPMYTMNSDEGSKDQRLFNLSHELVHALTPDEKSEVTVFEEGLATYFSEEYTYKKLRVKLRVPPGKEAYAIAGNLVRQLLKMDKAIVKKLRERHPDRKLSELTEDDFIDVLGPEVTSLAKSLTKQFNPMSKGW